MNKFIQRGLVAVGALSTVFVSSSAFAVSAAETAITDAVTSGETMVGLVAPGVIGIAAIMMGVGIAVAWLKK